MVVFPADQSMCSRLNCLNIAFAILCKIARIS